MFINILLMNLSKLFLVAAYYKSNVFPKPLGKQKERELLIKHSKGDNEARETLIVHNLRLVAHIAKKYETAKVENEDLISIGTVGLIKGIDTFKHKHGTQLTTYVARCIDNEILMHLRNLKKRRKDVSLYDPIGHDKEGNELTLIDVLESKEDDHFTKLDLKNNLEALFKYIHILNERELEIVSNRFGLNNQATKTQREIGKDLHISRSYVSRIEKRALTKLFREFIKDKQV